MTFYVKYDIIFLTIKPTILRKAIMLDYEKIQKERKKLIRHEIRKCKIALLKNFLPISVFLSNVKTRLTKESRNILKKEDTKYMELSVLGLQ